MSVISIRELARKVNANPEMVRGVIAGLGLKVQRTANAVLVPAKEVDRIQRCVDAYRKTEKAQAVS